MRPIRWNQCIVRSLCLCVVCLSVLHEARVGAVESTLIAGTVQNQDLRRVGQVLVEVKDQEGALVTTGVSNDAGEFNIPVPNDGTYSVSAVQDTYRSEYIVLKVGTEMPNPIILTLSKIGRASCRERV